MVPTFGFPQEKMQEAQPQELIPKFRALAGAQHLSKGTEQPQPTLVA